MTKEAVKITGKYIFLLDNKIIRVVPNQLIKAQMNHMKHLLLGITPPDITIEYCALGTGTTAATETDTTLETEGARIFRTNLYGQSNQIIGEFTFTGAQAVGTWTEVGLFAGNAVATSSPDTGYLYSRAIITPAIVKTTGKELTIRHVTTWNY